MNILVQNVNYVTLIIEILLALILAHNFQNTKTCIHQLTQDVLLPLDKLHRPPPVIKYSVRWKPCSGPFLFCGRAATRRRWKVLEKRSKVPVTLFSCASASLLFPTSPLIGRLIRRRAEILRRFHVQTLTKS